MEGDEVGHDDDGNGDEAGDEDNVDVISDHDYDNNDDNNINDGNVVKMVSKLHFRRPAAPPSSIFVNFT